MINRSDVLAAGTRIAGRVRETPVIRVHVDGRPLILKLELLQHTGSFKPRGAFNRVLSADLIPEAGLITASGGNHGAAVAFVGSQLGMPVEVFVPEVTSPLKRNRIAGYGAKVIVSGRHYPDALEASKERRDETGALEIHAYDHPATVAGQGTMAAEIHRQVPNVSSVVMAVGGGGFLAGATSYFEGDVPVIGVEPRGSAALAAALDAGQPVPVTIDSIAADSLGASPVGSVPFESIAGRIATVVLVEDSEIVAAQKWLWAELRLIAEPGGAAALASVLSGGWPSDPETVVVVCGANADPATIV